ncbi:unnamed protein product, partial [Brachionus calyciflorus]
YLNKLVGELVKNLEEYFKATIKQWLDENIFTRKMCKDEIEKFKIGKTNEAIDENLIKILSQIDSNKHIEDICLTTLSTFRILNDICNQDLTSINNSCSHAFGMFEELIEKINNFTQKVPVSCFETQFESPIILASEIKNIYNKQNKENKESKIILKCVLFILDEDLILPSLSLAIISSKWKVYGQLKKIDLSGDSDESPHAGHFYSNPDTKIDG